MDCVYTNRNTSSFYERGELGSKTGLLELRWLKLTPINYLQLHALFDGVNW